MTEEQWWQVIETNDEEIETWLTFSDWLEEQGRLPEARACRDLYNYRKQRKIDRPTEDNSATLVDCSRSCDWWPTHFKDGLELQLYLTLLPPPEAKRVWSYKAKQANSYAEYPSRASAYQHLIKALIYTEEVRKRLEAMEIEPHQSD